MYDILFCSVCVLLGFSRSYAVPKLNLQFLSLYDYLLRNFHLYRLESAYEVREDLTDAIKRMCPRVSHHAAVTATAHQKSASASGGGGGIMYHGWARMALPVSVVTIDEVSE